MNVRRGHAAGHPVKLELVGAAGDTEFAPAVADHVQEGRLAGRPDRIPERGDDRAGAEPDGLGLRREIGQQHHRVWRDRVLHRVVLADPHRAEAALFGDLGEFGQIIQEFTVGDRLVIPLHVDEQRESHASCLSLSASGRSRPRVCGCRSISARVTPAVAQCDRGTSRGSLRRAARQLRRTKGSATGSSLVLTQMLLSRVYSLIVSWPCSTPTPLFLKPWRGDIGDIAR